MKSIYEHQFVIGIKKINESSKFLFENKKNINEFLIIKNPLFRWAADPFIISYRSKNYVFAEIYNSFTGKGNISFMDINSKKRRWVKCKIEKCHLSFPNVFIKNNSLFMLPETYQKKEISIYKAEKDLKEWTKYKILKSSVTCVDSIIFQNYLITYDISRKKDKKLIVYDDTLNIKYTLKDFFNCLRPGGNIIQNKNQIIFVSQLNKNTYGDGLIFNEVNKNFEIKKIMTITENDIILKYNKYKIKGIHTYNKNEKYEVVDFLYSKLSFFHILGFPYRVLNRFLKGIKN